MLMQLPNEDKQNYGEYKPTNRKRRRGWGDVRRVNLWLQGEQFTQLMHSDVPNVKVWLSSESPDKNTSFMNGELGNGSSTGLHEKCMMKNVVKAV